MEKPRARGRHRVLVENEMIRRREKEFSHQQMWTGADNYYRHWEKANTKFDAWTSPRYYEDNNKLMTEIRNKRAKEELLVKRREKLGKLLEEEQRTYEIELMVRRNRNILDDKAKSKTEQVPTDVLKEVNVGLKLEEEERRRHEAEIKLYHQWRKNNPIIRQFESKYRCKDLKLSWLDQQIEKRMQREKEEEECKKLVKERDERLRKEKEKEEEFKKQVEKKRQQLRDGLEKQITELKQKQEIGEGLKKKEEEEIKRQCTLAELEEKQTAEEKRRSERECVLYNIRQHKLKLKQKAADVQENLAREKLLVSKLRQVQLEDVVADEFKRNEIKQGLAEFLSIVKEQQELEKQRQKHLEFLFDSEAKMVYEKQSEIWRREEMARQKLVRDVLNTVKKQIDDNLQKNKDEQKQILLQREEMVAKIEEYDKELERLKEEEEQRKVTMKKMMEDDVKLKSLKKKHKENLKLKEIDEELERIQKEEERLQDEILKIQRRQGPIRPRPRTGLIF